MRAALVVLPATLLAAGLAAAGSSAAPARPAAAHPRAVAAASRAVVKTRHGALGTFLVDRHGRTLYLFRKDRHGRSRCSGACAQVWPPLITHGRPKARGGAKASKLGTTRRRNGARQVTYAGHPLYRYELDSAPGDTTGQGLDLFGATWWVVSREGHRITGMSSSPGPYG
jgi:predicted lipoprotein with Yx(FWY)xxD motif